MPAPVYEFDRFELDVRGYELRRAGRKVRLQRVPMDLLILLLDRNGALVTRDEIAARVWNGDGLVDTQSSINTAIRKIRQALGDDGEKPQFVETVVGKGYRFAGEVSARAPAQETAETAIAPDQPAAMKTELPAVPPKQRRVLIVLAAVAGAVVVGAIEVLLPGLLSPKTEPMTVAPFTAIPGLQSWPAFSPDGSQVAFGWTGETGNCSHIYVKAVDSASPVKLTDAQQCDGSPSWSRDGRSIAFLRKQSDGRLGLYVASASGGNARRISSIDGPSDYRPAWTPDGKALAVMDSQPPEAPPSLFRVAIDSGEKRRITAAEPTSTGDWCPAYSPNGRMLAYLHNTGSRRLSPLYVVPVDGQGRTSGSARRIESGSAGFIDFDWSADGRSLICTTPSGLVRVPISGGGVEPLPFPDGGQPTVALHGNRMVYVRPFRDTDVFRVPGPGASGAVSRLISSTRQEFAPQYSAGGQRIVFVSDRTGSEEIWTTAGDGSDARQITSFAGPSVGSPRWSPDGKWIAFDSTAGGRTGIYVVADGGGAARRITSAAVSCVRPSWSRDGKWIYFGSNQSGEWEIWKTTPQGGRVQVTRKGGREAFEDLDGKFVYYTKPPPEKGVWRVPSSGGEATKISDAGVQGRWALGGRGVYYLKGPDQLVFQEFSTMRCLPVATPGLQLGVSAPNMIGVAPDDRWILLSILVRSEDHLILVRNFQ